MNKKVKILLNTGIIFIMISTVGASICGGKIQQTNAINTNFDINSVNANTFNNRIHGYNFCNIHQYNYGNEKIILHGNKIFIDFNNHIYKVNWNVVNVKQSGLTKVKFSTYKINRIKNNYQNSIVLINSNSILKSAEIFTFKKNSIDASIAIKNLENKNATYIVTFELETRHHNIIYLTGNNSIKINMENHSLNVVNKIIPSGYSRLSMGNLKIGWQNDLSLFHFGVVSTSSTASKTLLPFGPITLLSNETYTIDPSIEPAVPHICACSGGGGGSGGSGGSSSSSTPPTLSSFKMDTTYDDTIQGKTNIKMTADVSSLGSGPDVLEFYVFNDMTNQLDQFYSRDISSTGEYTVTWSANPGIYSFFTADVYNSNTHCGESMDAGHSFNVYTEFPYSGENGKCYPGQTYKSSPVYNSNGNLIGYLTLQATGSHHPMDKNSFPEMCFTTSFLRLNSKSDYCVHSVSQDFKWTGNQIKTPTSNDWVKFSVCSESYQNAQNGSWQPVEKSLYAALTVLVTSESLGVGAIMAALYPIFFHQISTSLPSGCNNIDISHTAITKHLRRSATILYCPLGYYYGALDFKNSYVFEFKQEMRFIGSPGINYTPTNAVLNYFDYSADYKITTGGNGLFSGTVSEPIYIAQY